MITRRDAVRFLLASAGGILTRRATAQTPRPIPRDAPNILLIMTDDQRYDALSIAGNKILRTPNIDRIGAEGIRFTEFIVRAEPRQLLHRPLFARSRRTHERIGRGEPESGRLAPGSNHLHPSVAA